MGGATNFSVDVLTVFDDGTGSALYAGGTFTMIGGVSANRIAKWDGLSWAPLGSGLNDGVGTITSFDHGTGAALYVGGLFTSAGGVAANRIASWDGTNWSPLGSGMNLSVLCLSTFNDGAGSELVAGGRFTSAGGTPVNRIAKWNGLVWSPLGTGCDERVQRLIAFNDGTGPALYAGGRFTQAGGLSAKGFAKWDGATWSAFDNGINWVASVDAFVVFDDGNGPALHVSGAFGIPGVFTDGQVAKWDGSSWVGVGTSLDLPRCLAVFDDGSGEFLLAGGFLSQLSGVIVNKIGKWNGQSWSSFANNGTSTIEQGGVSDLVVFDDGNGPMLYAGGSMLLAGDAVYTGLATWNGTAWTKVPLLAGLTGGVSQLLVFDDGNGDALYAAVGQQSAAGSPMIVSKWDGVNWSALGTGMTGGDSTINSLASFDDGTGETLYACGSFTNAGGVPASNVAKWDGANWASLGLGVSARARAITAYDDGTGSALYLAGDFLDAGGAPANRIAKWDGSNWGTLGAGIGTFSNVHALIVFDDGAGSCLYVGGRFTNAGGMSANNIARWNGSSWSSLGSGVAFGGIPQVVDLTIFNDGGGDALYAGGRFTMAGGIAANSIARWDGATWFPLAGGLSDVSTMASYDDGTGPGLFVGGNFNAANDSGDRRMAKWGCNPVTAYASFCYGDGGDQAGCTDCPCSNNAPAGSIAGCVNSNSRCAQLEAFGVPSVANDSMNFSMTGGTSNSFALLSSGASRAPANATNPCFGLGSGIQSPAFDGLRCVVQSVLRHGTRTTDLSGEIGFQTNGWGPPHGPVGGLIAQGGFVAGQTRHYQVVYRDEVTLGCMTGLNTSQGITVTFEP